MVGARFHFLFLMLLVALKDAATTDIHVSRISASRDIPTCGGVDLPCFSIVYAVKVSSNHDSILLDAYYEFLQQDGQLQIDKSILFASYNCSKNHKKSTITFANSFKHNAYFNVTMSNISIFNIELVTEYREFYFLLHGDQVNITMSDCGVTVNLTDRTRMMFIFSFDSSTTTIKYSSVNIINTNFTFQSWENQPLLTNADQSKSFTNYVDHQNVFLTLSRCSFKMADTSTIESAIIGFTSNEALVLKNCKFKDMEISVINVYKTQIIKSMFLRCKLKFPIYAEFPYTFIVFHQTTFEGSLPGELQVHVEHKGALLINSCLFHRATSGSLFVASSTDVSVNNTIFRNNIQQSRLNFFKLSAGATIGAVRSVKIRYCIFRNNTSSDVAFSSIIITSIYLKRRVEIDIVDTTFIPGVLVQDDDLSREIWVSNWPRIGQKKLTHTKDVYIYCPHNYNIRLKKNSVYDMIISCVKCNSVSYSANLHSYIMFQEHHHQIKTIQCYSCPYQANCVGGIRSKGNYWGYANKTGAVTFKICPPKYCCSSLSECKTYKTCGKNRKGRLCGDCLEGHSLSIVGGLNKCVKTEICGSKMFWLWYLVFAVLAVSFLLYKKEGINFLKSLILRMLNTKKKVMKNVNSENEQSNNNSDDLEILRQEVLTQKQKDGRMSGIVKITFFFYQVASIIRINASAKSNYTIPIIVEVFTSLFNIKIETQTDGHINLCPLETNRVIVIESIKVSIVYVCAATLVSSYIIYLLVKKYKDKRSNSDMLTDDDDGHYYEAEPASNTIPFSARIKGAYAILLILGYSSIANFCLHSINCIDIDGQSYLYLQAESVKCYQYWQIVIILYIIVWLLPFPVAVYVGCRLLRQHCITCNDYILIVTFPPSLLYYIYKYYRNQNTHLLVNEEDINFKETTHVLALLNAPFRHEEGGFQCIWEPVLIGRRLILISFCTFIILPMIKLYAVTFMLLLFLVQDFKVKPFILKKLNDGQCVAMVLLMLLTLVNFFWSFSNDIDIAENPVYEGMGRCFLILEVLILLAPLIYLLMLCLCKLFKHFYKKVVCKHD